jgi:dUTPase
MYVLQIKTDDRELADLYKKHSVMHKGDSGLDLFIPEEVVVSYGERKKINLGIKTALFHIDESGKLNSSSWRLVPRSSIVKTPLVMTNIDGIKSYKKEFTEFVKYIQEIRESINLTNDIIDNVCNTLSIISNESPLVMSNTEGIIDAGYRGDVCGFVDHIKQEQGPIKLDKHSKLFQIITPDMKPISKIEIVDNFENTSRGEDGFGSTT